MPGLHPTTSVPLLQQGDTYTRSQEYQTLRCRNTFAISAATLLRVVVVRGSHVVARGSFYGRTSLQRDCCKVADTRSNSQDRDDSFKHA